MGSSSETYKDLQVIPVMEDYKDLDKTLLLYDAQQLSRGMPAVLGARKQTMYKMRTTMKKSVMERWGFGASTNAQIQRVDYDLVLDHLQNIIGESVTSISYADVGIATKYEQGHIILQGLYSDYSVEDREFLHTDGYTYLHTNTVEAGAGLLDVISYRRPTKASIEAELDLMYDTIYDTIIVTSYSQYPVETSPGVFEFEVPFNYKTYHVTITVNDGETVTTTEYDTTWIGDVVAGSVVEGEVTTTTTITSRTLSKTVYLPVIYLYLTGEDSSYDFLDGVITDYSGTSAGLSTVGWKRTYYVDDSTIPSYQYGLGDIPHIANASNAEQYSAIDVGYTINTSIMEISDTEVNITATASNVSVPELKDSVEAFEKNRIYELIDKRLQENHRNIVVKYIKDNKQYLYQIDNTEASLFLVNDYMSVMPVFQLKSGGVLSSNPKTELALRELGMVGDEFNDSLQDTAVMYASLGFMFDVNNDDITTTKLMYETFRYLQSTGSKPGVDYMNQWVDGQGFNMNYGGLSVGVAVTSTMTTIEGSIGPIGTYNSTITNYTVQQTEYDTSTGDRYTIDVPMVRRIYRKQESSDYYTELNISDLRVRHNYAGVSTNSIRGTYGNRLDVGRIPIIREVLLKLPFHEYIQILQMSMSLFVFTYKTVKTKWYQSGFFRFVMLVVAIGIAVVSWGTGSGAIGAVLSGTATLGTTLTAIAYVGLIAGIVLSVAGMLGIDLGIVGEVLQVIAIIGAVAALGVMMIAPTPPPAATTGGSTLSQSGTTCFNVAEQAQIANDFKLAMDATNLGKDFMELASQYSIASMGNTAAGIGEALSPAMQVVDNVTTNLTRTLAEGAVPNIPVPSIEVSLMDTVTSGISTSVKVLNKTGGIYSDIKGMMDRSRLSKMSSGLEEMEKMRDLAQAELDALMEQKGKALMMAPSGISTMYDRACTVPDPMMGMDDMHDSLVNSINVNTETMMWA